MNAVRPPLLAPTVDTFAQQHARLIEHAVFDTGHLFLATMTATGEKASTPVRDRMKDAFHVTTSNVRDVVISIDHPVLILGGLRKRTQGVKAAIRLAKKIGDADHTNCRFIPQVHLARALGRAPDKMFIKVLDRLGISLDQYVEAVEVRF